MRQILEKLRVLLRLLRIEQVSFQIRFNGGHSWSFDIESEDQK